MLTKRALSSLLIMMLVATGGCDDDPVNDGGPCTPVPEECNNRDDDCDGVVDEADTGGPLRRSCNNACGTGQEECEAGEWAYCSAPQPTEEVCDGFDNDCDSFTDEDCVCRHGERRECGIDVGVCEPGIEICDAGTWGNCQLSYDPETLEELCNDGLDNDCDGDTDEACTCVPGDTQECGRSEGECEPGTQTCLEGSTWDEECVGAIGPETDTCDGLDNNCDGEIDFVLATDFGWQNDSNEPNNECNDAAPIYNDDGVIELLEGAGWVSPTVGDTDELMTYPSLYPVGDEDWYYTATREIEDCSRLNPFSTRDCAFRLTVQLWLADRALVGGAVQNPEDWRLCFTVGECTGTDSQEFCSRGSDFSESSNSYSLSVVWGSPCGDTGPRDLKIRVFSPTGAACGYYQVYAMFEYDDTLECPE